MIVSLLNRVENIVAKYEKCSFWAVSPCLCYIWSYLCHNCVISVLYLCYICVIYVSHLWSMKYKLRLDLHVCLVRTFTVLQYVCKIDLMGVSSYWLFLTIRRSLTPMQQTTFKKHCDKRGNCPHTISIYERKSI